MRAPRAAAACACALLLPAPGAAKKGKKDEKPKFDNKDDINDMLKKMGMKGNVFNADDLKNMDFSKMGGGGGGGGYGGGDMEPLPKKLGVVGVDAWSLDAIADGSRTVLLKIDKEYPWGEQEDAWKKLSEKLADIDAPDLLLAEVGVQEYGDDKYNERVAERFGVEVPGGFPAFRLLQKGGGEAVTYSGSATLDGLSRFLLEKVGVRIPLGGTIPAFDDLVKRFLSAETAGKGAVLREAKAAAKELSEKEAPAGKYYLSVMKKIHAQAQGEGVIVGCSDDESVQDCEKTRIEKKLKDRKTPEKSKKGLRENLNVLASFREEL